MTHTRPERAVQEVDGQLPAAENIKMLEHSTHAPHHVAGHDVGVPAPRGDGAPGSTVVGGAVRAGLVGAVFTGVTSGVIETARVRNGEIETEEAVRNVAKSSAQGAATMAVASVAANAARAYPLVSVFVLAAAGIGALLLMENSRQKSRRRPKRKVRTAKSQAEEKPQPAKKSPRRPPRKKAVDTASS